MDDLQRKVLKKLNQNLDKFEAITTAIALTAYLLILSGLDSAGLILTISLSTIACLYFYNAFSIIENEFATQIDRFFNYTIYWGLSTGVLGILFELKHWPGGNNLIYICSFTSVTGLLYVLFSRRRIQSTELFSNRVLLRLIVIAGIAIALLLAEFNAN